MCTQVFSCDTQKPPFSEVFRKKRKRKDLEYWEKVNLIKHMLSQQPPGNCPS